MRAAALLVLAALLAAGCTLPGDADVAPVDDAPPPPPRDDALLREDWSREGAWNASGGGARRECPLGGACHLVVDAACCGPLKVRRDLDAPLPERFAAAWRFLGESTHGGEDSNVVLYLAEGVGLTVTHTDDADGANALRLFSTGVGSVALPRPWAAGAWHEVRVLADFAAGEARVELRGPAGLVGRSDALRLPDAPRVLRAVAFEALDPAGNSPGFRYGPIEVAPWTPEPDAPAPLVEEAWADGLQGWTVVGEAAEAPCDARGACALEMRPCCRDALLVRRAVDAPLPARVEASFRFRAGSLDDSGDASVVLYTAPRVGVTVTMTAGGSTGNNGVLLYSTGNGQAEVGAWPEPEAWYVVRVTLDRGEGTVHAELLDANGALLARSRALRLPEASERLESVAFEALGYAPGARFGFDDLRVAAVA